MPTRRPSHEFTIDKNSFVHCDKSIRSSPVANRSPMKKDDARRPEFVFVFVLSKGLFGSAKNLANGNAWRPISPCSRALIKRRSRASHIPNQAQKSRVWVALMQMCKKCACWVKKECSSNNAFHIAVSFLVPSDCDCLVNI